VIKDVITTNLCRIKTSFKFTKRVNGVEWHPIPLFSCDEA
jgi:hypothetical protein